MSATQDGHPALPPPRAAWPTRAAGWLVDLGVLAWLLNLRWVAQWRGRPDALPEGLEGIPEAWWRVGTLSDMLLYGPDSGNWAWNAHAFRVGAQLDIHRMPVYTYLTAFASRWTDDVVFAGHMVNHLASGLVPLLTYTLGRLCAGRGAALLGAALVAACPALLNVKNLYGVDPSLQLVFMLLVLCSWLAARVHWAFTPLAGVAAGLCAGTHYLGLLFPIPVLFLLLFSDGGWRRRLLTPLLVLGLGLATWKLLLRPYPPIGLAKVAQVYAEGVIGSSGGFAANHQEGVGTAAALVLGRLGSAGPMAAQRAMAHFAVDVLPWGALLALGWAGLLGLGLHPGRRWGWDRRGSLWLGVLLLPLVALEAARAPERYTFYSLPLVALLLGRGVASAAAGVDLGLRRLWSRWPRGLLAFGLAALLVTRFVPALQVRWPGSPPTEEALQDRVAGALILEEFPGWGGLVSSAQNLLFYTGRLRCPRQSCADEGERTLQACAALLLEQCVGQGDIPWVIEEKTSYGFADQPEERVNQAVATRFQAVGSIPGPRRTLTVYRLPREELRALLLGGP